jgi:hypothetical protein
MYVYSHCLVYILLTSLKFTIWSGLPKAWIIKCFGDELEKVLVERKMIELKAEEAPAHKLSFPQLSDAEL